MPAGKSTPQSPGVAPTDALPFVAGQRDSNDDLVSLNRGIAEHWLGRLNAAQEAYVANVPVCLGELSHSADAIARVLASAGLNPLPVARLNHRYLRYVRLAASEAAGSRPELLIELGIDLAQAALLRALTDDELDRLAFLWEGPIVRFEPRRLASGEALHERAALFHAAAFVATRGVGSRRGRP